MAALPVRGAAVPLVDSRIDDVARELRLYLRVDKRQAPAFATFALSDEFRPGKYRLVVDRTGRTFRLEGRGGGELQHGAVGDSVGQALGFGWAPSAAVLPSGSELSFAVTSLRGAAKRLGDALTVAIDPSGNFLRLSLTNADGVAAATTVNAVAQRYVAAASRLKRAKLTELARLLDEQLQSAGGNLRLAEDALEAFRSRTITLPPDPGAASASAALRGSPLSDFLDTVTPTTIPWCGD